MAQTHNGDVDELINSKETTFGLTLALSEYPTDFAPTRDMTLNGGNYYSYKSLALVNPYPRLSGKQYAPKFRAVVFGQVVGQKLTVGYIYTSWVWLQHAEFSRRLLGRVS